LIANLLLMVLLKRIKRNWSFSNLATMVRIMLMHNIDCYSFFEHPEKDWLKILDTHDNPPDKPSLFD
jgi:transposase